MKLELQAASEAGLLRASTTWSRASGSSLRSDRTPAKRAGGRGGREVERSETSANPAYTMRRVSVAPRILGGAPLAPPGSVKSLPEERRQRLVHRPELAHGVRVVQLA